MPRRSPIKLIRYRDPGFLDGLCASCRKRQRVFDHEFYPNMCDKCRNSRVRIGMKGMRKAEPVPMLSREQVREIAADHGIKLVHDRQLDDPFKDPLFLQRYNELSPLDKLNMDRAIADRLKEVEDVQNLNTSVDDDLVKKINEAFS
jgi:hypothetical protein